MARSMDRLRQRYRRRGRETTAEWDDHAAGDASPAQCAEAAELSERLRNALAELPVKQAEAFCLFNLEGWTYQEIGVQLNCSIDNVGVLLHRARTKLRQRLSQVAPSE
jgi:RNA polymerase sigma-70 factor (ECF subfamily)